MEQIDKLNKRYVELSRGDYAYSRTAAVADAHGRVQRQRGGGSGNPKRAEHARRKLARRRQAQHGGMAD